VEEVLVSAGTIVVMLVLYFGGKAIVNWRTRPSRSSAEFWHWDEKH
jgi:hypothetical protein